jgi:carbamoyltransferase
MAVNEGINASVCLLQDGEIMFALEEERVNHQKNYLGFPGDSIKFMMEYLGVKPNDFDKVVFCNITSPIITKAGFYQRYDLAFCKELTVPTVKDNMITYARRMYRDYVPQQIRMIRINEYKRRVSQEREERNRVVDSKLLSLGFNQNQITRIEHHIAHAASAYYGLRMDPKEKYLVLTLDGGGDDICSTVHVCENGRMERIAETQSGNSLGNIYARVTHYMGFTPHEHEYKLMGLAAYSRKEDAIRVKNVFCSYLQLDPTNDIVFKSLIPEGTFNIAPYLKRDLAKMRFDNIAGGLQLFTEELLVEWIKNSVKRTGIRKVLLAGGVFMNVKANKLISELDEIEYVNVFPSCGDESLVFGAAFHWYASLTGNHDKIKFDRYTLGPDASFDLDEARSIYEDRCEFSHLKDCEYQIARMLSEGKIIARCSGPMEFGARALGNRSILADPKDPLIVPKINAMIKKRDFWMPFSPAIIKEDADKYLKVPRTLHPDNVSPYMMFLFDTRSNYRDMIAAVHIADKTARPQIVNEEMYPSLLKILSFFKELTGRSAILNTSFNLHGYPIVMGAKDAIEVFLNSSLDYLIIDDTLVKKLHVALGQNEDNRST